MKVDFLKEQILPAHKKWRGEFLEKIYFTIKSF